MKNIIILFIIFFFNIIYSQENNFAPFFSAGIASDNDAIGSFGGGGGGLQAWYPGPIFRLGTDYKLNKSFYVQGFISYSFYKYDGSYSYGEKQVSVITIY